MALYSFCDVEFQSQYLFPKLNQGATISLVSGKSSQAWIFPSSLFKNSTPFLGIGLVRCMDLSLNKVTQSIDTDMAFTPY